MGGEIELQSKPGAGSCFSFDLCLPVDEAPRQTAARTYLGTSGYEGRRRRILVVDDLKANRLVTIDMLRMLQFDTLEATNGREALEQASKQHPDLVIMDVRMPGMDGIEAIKALRRIEGFAGLPIVTISASSYDADSQRALAAGANAFLPKPVEYERLAEQLGALLGLQWRH
jgi:CheY-like chemotaxis protein